jgi:HAD superfamily hydrolase (TIGR01509 family)
MLRALIFDFDGLIVDTETPLLRSWQEVFEHWRVPIDEGQLARLVEHDREPPEAYRLLQSALGDRLNPEAVREGRATREAQLISQEPAAPGLLALLKDAKAAGIKTGIASNSRLDWIGPQLHRLDLASAFDSVRCRDNVQRVKPDPQLYLAVLKDLGMQRHEVVAFEDAPAGAQAAHLAGIFCVAVPNLATKSLSWGSVDLTIPSLTSMSIRRLNELLLHRDPG